MKILLKYLGLILILISVAILAINHFQGTTTNVSLGICGLLLIVGLVSHIFLNRKVQ